MNNENSNKAYIKILKGSHKDEVIPLQFNPTEYSLEKTNTFQEKKLKHKKEKKLQFKQSQQSDITLELLFDGTDEGKDVRELLEPLTHIVDIDKEIHAPPLCMFVWGGLSVNAVVSKLSKKFTYFYQDGIPARVRVSMILKPFKTTEEIEKETKLQSADLTKVRRSKEGDNIWLMAYREYEDAKQWRAIANANEIDDPRVLENGRELILPPRKEDA